MLYKGKTIDEALALAEKDLGIKRDEFSYSVTEKKIGLFKKEVEVHIKEKKTSAAGEIKEGEFIFHKGEGEVRLIPSKEVEVEKNGGIVINPIKVKEDDKIILRGKKTEEFKGFIIEVSENNLEVVLKVISRPEVIYGVEDHSPSNEIIVKGNIIKKGEVEKISLDEVKKELFNKGIKYGISFKLIESALQRGSGIIAKGKEVVKAKDDKQIYFFSSKDTRKHIEINGKVDYYSIEEIESVKIGDILAEIEEGTDGENGVDVFGKIIESKPKKSTTLKVGSGAQITEDGKKVVALIDGKPNLKGGKIVVLPSFEISGDADMKIGNLGFDGDVIISGSVKEGMKISAGGSVQVGKSVLEASIHAKENIIIKENLIASTAKAGNIGLNDLKYINELNEIKDFLSELIDVGEEAKGILPKKYSVLSYSQILSKIIDSKYTMKKVYFKELKSIYPQMRMDSEIKTMLNKFFEVYQDIISNKEVTLKDLVGFKISIEDFLILHNSEESGADIYVSYSQNSNMYSSGDVYITGNGCYSTDIEAEGKVYIQGVPGTFRSGTVYGKSGVYIKEVGSTAGIKSIIKTEKDGEIHADIIYHNTLIMVGSYNYYVDEPIKTVKIFVKDNELVVEKFKL